MNLINEEVATSRMDGPFTIEEAQCIYGGHFRMCPLGLVDKPGSADLRMIRHFLKDNQFDHSTNSWIDSNDFPMCWFMATIIANFVSTLYILLPLLCCLPPCAFSARHVQFVPICVSCMGCQSLWV